VQLNVVTTPTEVAGPFDAHSAALGTGPDVTTVINPLGATAPVVPVTITLNINEPPSVGVELLDITTDGVAKATLTPVGEKVAEPAL